MLDKERAYFSAHAEEWATQSPGRFVVVKDETLVGAFATLEEAVIHHLGEADRELIEDKFHV